MTNSLAFIVNPSFLFIISTTMHDPRRTIGATVTAKAKHVTSLANCSPFYGSQAKEKTSWHSGCNPFRPNGQESKTKLEVDWGRAGGVKRTRMNICNIKMVPGPSSHPRIDSFPHLDADQNGTTEISPETACIRDPCITDTSLETPTSNTESVSVR